MNYQKYQIKLKILKLTFYNPKTLTNHFITMTIYNHSSNILRGQNDKKNWVRTANGLSTMGSPKGLSSNPDIFFQINIGFNCLM